MVSALLKRFSNDETLEEGGRWTDFGDGIRIKIRRIRSKKSLDVRKELEKPYLAELRRGPLPDSVVEDLLIKQLAAGVVSDWSGIDIGEGDMPFTIDNAYKVFKQFPDLRDAVIQISVDGDNYRKQFEETAVLENLSDTSAGA